MTGTPASATTFLDSRLEPSRRITSGAGPMKISPAAAQAAAKSAFSARKP